MLIRVHPWTIFLYKLPADQSRQFAEQDDSGKIGDQIAIIEASAANEDLREFFEKNNCQNDQCSDQNIHPPESKSSRPQSQIDQQREKAHQQKMPHLIAVRQAPDRTKKILRFANVG